MVNFYVKVYNVYINIFKIRGGEHMIKIIMNSGKEYEIHDADLNLFNTTYHFWDAQAVDFGQFLQDQNFSKLIIVVKGLQVLSSCALVVFYSFKIRSWIVNYDEYTADISAEIPFLS